MDDDMIALHLENIDRRLTTVAQILPTLATKEDLEALAAKVDTLATKKELAALSTKIDIIGEALRSDIQLLAEHLATVMPRPLEG